MVAAVAYARARGAKTAAVTCNHGTPLSEAAETTIVQHHLAYHGPIAIDARKKPSLPDELIVRDDIAELVDSRWGEYFPSGV